MPALGCALLGAGNFAKGAHLPAVAASSDTLVLRAAYSRSQESVASLAVAAEAFAATASVEIYYDSPESPGRSLAALLARDDISVAILSLPITFQPSVIRRCWAAGKHVVSEKPVAADLAEATQLIKVYETEYRPRGLMWIIAEQFPYEETFSIAKDILESGKIGPLRSFSLDYNNFIAPGNKTHDTVWRKTPQFQGGFLLDGGVHFIAGLRHILPSPLASLSAITTLISSHLAPADLLLAVATTESGIQGSIRISWGIESSLKRFYIFYGPLGRVEVDFGAHDDGHFVVSTFLVGRSAPEVVKAKAQAVFTEFKFFGKALVSGIDSEAAKEVDARSGPRATLRDLAVIEGALSSNGAAVKLASLLSVN